MGLRELDLNVEYDSATDDIYGDFFNPVLKQSVTYRRVGGKFDSKSLATCAEGLQDFIQKDGNMKLLLVPEFTRQDADSINRGIKNQHDILTECWIKDFSEIQDKFVHDHVKALAWMLANDHLEIKIAVPTKDDGTVMSRDGWRHNPLFRNQVGIFWDGANDPVSFSGTVDLDDKVFGEYHHFRVFRGWDESEKRYLEKDFERFTRYWNDGYSEPGISLKPASLPDALRDNLINIAPKSKSAIRLRSVPRLRPYQKEAIHKWIDNGKKGMFEMATGTGKTFAAIGCINEVRKTDKKLTVVIACPFDNLERQWQRELQKWGMDSMITSDGPNWIRNIKDGIASITVSDKQNLFLVITTYKTLSSEKFVNAIKRSNIPTMLVADEAHNAGSPTYRKGLSDSYQYRLGLSATLVRYFDPEGTEFISNFFGHTVYTMDIANAINHRFLVEYYYHIIPADLNTDEYARYRRLTSEIACLWNSKNPDDKELLEQTLIKRSRVIRDAEEKLDKFSEWAEQCKEHAKYALVYCSERHMKSVKKILRDSDIINREITAKNPSNPRERTEIIREFGNGRYDVIVANRVLDEGADIPAAKNCFMLASTGNPKQFIQRRGRVLRRYAEKYRDGSTKEHASIFDVIILPALSPDYDEDEIRTERQIISSQICRIEDMASSARNRDALLEQIEDMKRKFMIS